jgi:uncharacterized RDD family membrane protein YckC
LAKTLDPLLASVMQTGDNPAERLLVTPEGVPLVVKLAERGERLGAVLLDVLFIVVANIALVLLIVLMLALFRIEEAWGFFAILFLLGRFLIGTFYFSFFELRWNGQTPGKRISSPTSRMEAFSTLGIAMWIFAMLYVMFLNRDRMRGGDLIAGTWVIHAPKSELLKDVATQVDTADSRFRFTPAQLAVYGVYELQTLETVLRERRTDVVPEVAKRVRAKIDWNDDHLIVNPRDNLDFLQAYYTGARRHHEGRLLFGKRKKDKFDAG